MDGVSLLKASFNKFSYKKHVHQEFAIGVIEQGVQRFFHSGEKRVSTPETIITLNPDEVHDGSSATEGGYQYRMIYVSQQKIHEILAGHAGDEKVHGYFRAPVTEDKQLAASFRQALSLFDGDSRNHLESETVLAQAITDLFHHHSTHLLKSSGPVRDQRVVKQSLEYIRSRVAENVSLEEIAASVGLSRYHFLRLFKRTTGLPPHAYLVAMRVEMARRSIDTGESLSSAAYQAGFSDQSHMSRCFKSVYGLTPGQYKKAV